MTPARALMMALLASASLVSATPAAAHGVDTAAVNHSGGWLASAVKYIASCLPGSGSTSGGHSLSSRDSVSHGNWWSSGSDETDDKSHYSAGSRSTPTGFTGSSSTGTGATGDNGAGENGGFGGSLGSGDGSESGGAGVAGTGSGNTGAGAAASTDVPEPGMLGLFGAGLIPLALRRRAKRKSA